MIKIDIVDSLLNMHEDGVNHAGRAADEITSLRKELYEERESNIAVEAALDDVDYKGSFADGIMYLKNQVEELQNALKPFAQFACSPKGECDCHNCKARDLLET